MCTISTIIGLLRPFNRCLFSWFKKKLSKPSEKQERKKRFLNVSSIISEHLLQISASFLLDYAKNNIMVL